MSFEFYSQWWAATKENLKLLSQEDAYMMASKATKFRSVANQLVGGMYAKYCMILQEMGTILDQMAQPQKRATVRKLMDAAIIRLHELNEELRTIDISEYHYIDGALIELKLVPHEIEILDPSLYYLRDYTIESLWEKIKNGEKIFIPPVSYTESTSELQSDHEPSHTILKKLKVSDNTPTPEDLLEISRKDKIDKLVHLIQNNERGRQARIYFIEKLNYQKYKKKIREGVKAAPPDPTLHDSSAVQMQRLWRGHAARQLTRRKEKQRRLLIGMTEPSWRSTKEFDKVEEDLQKRRVIRDERIKEYIEANLKERVRVFEIIGPRLMEDIGDEIREWFYQWYRQAKNFDKFPDEEKGGTVLVVRGETLTPKEWIEEVERKRREKVKAKGADKAKLKAEKEKKKKLLQDAKKKAKELLKKEALRKRKKRQKPYDYEMEFEATEAKQPLLDAFYEHKLLWDPRKDEDNPTERHYMDIIHEEKCLEMQLELRKQVDELMRLELQMLEEALAKDRGKKHKKKKDKKKKKKKGKKKGKKDPTGNRTTEDLFQELVDNGIIHSYPKQYLKDYKGDFSYSNWEMRVREFDPPACLGDVRQLVKVNCVIPLNAGQIKKPRSILLLGPRKSGKHLLANAVFNESQVVLFDLSPEITGLIYPGKQGLKMLLHLVNKMSRILQPSIIYFDGAEKIFYKKVPKPEKHLEPLRIGKKLLKGIVKTIKPEDRVMVFGISGLPWLAKAPKLKKAFEKVLVIPRPDYGSIYMYWRELLMPYHGLDRDINLSSLAKLTQFYPLNEIKRVVQRVFTPRRIIELCHKPLHVSELYELLMNIEPISDKEYKKFAKFYNKTPLGKERNIYNRFAQEARDRDAKQKDKKK